LEGDPSMSSQFFGIAIDCPDVEGNEFDLIAG
jgi:hypothetical protein